MKNIGDLKRAGDSSSADFVCGQPADIFFIKDNLASIRSELPADEVEKRGLSRTVGTDHGNQYTFIHGKVGPIDRLEIVK